MLFVLVNTLWHTGHSLEKYCFFFRFLKQSSHTVGHLKLSSRRFFFFFFGLNKYSTVYSQNEDSKIRSQIVRKIPQSSGSLALGVVVRIAVEIQIVQDVTILLVLKTITWLIAFIIYKLSVLCKFFMDVFGFHRSVLFSSVLLPKLHCKLLQDKGAYQRRGRAAIHAPVNLGSVSDTTTTAEG